MLLNGWAFNRTVRAKHAAITLLRFEQGAAGLAIIEKLAGIGRHGFRFGMPAVRACNCRVQNHTIHFPFPLTVDG